MRTRHIAGNSSWLGRALAGVALLLAGPVNAADASLGLDYTCKLPVVGERTVPVQVSAELPAKTLAGEPFGPHQLSTSLDLPALQPDGGIGFPVQTPATIEGTAAVELTMATSGRHIPTVADLSLQNTEIPDLARPSTVSADGTSPAVDLNDSDLGEARIRMGSLTLDVGLRDAEGESLASPLGEFTADCTPATGQDNELHRLSIVQPGEPEIGVVPDAVELGDVVIGTVAERTVTVSNTGNASMELTEIAVAGDAANAFAQSNDCTVLAGNESCDITVRFSPQYAGEQSGTLRIRSNDPDEPLIDVALTAYVHDHLPPEVEVAPSEVDFGRVATGATAVRNVTLSSTGGEPVTVTAVTIAGPDADAFVLSNDCTTFPADGQCQIYVTYVASGGGEQAATLTIHSTVPDKPSIEVPLRAFSPTPYVPRVRIEPETVDFGTVRVGNAVERAITVTNVGNHGLVVGRVRIDGPDAGAFTQTNDCGTLDAEAGCTIAVTFLPPGDGRHEASIVIGTNAPNANPFRVSLVGTVHESTRAQVDYTMAGATRIKAAHGELPLSGGMKANLDVATGALEADVQLEPTDGRLRLGLLKADVDLAFEPLGPVTGEIINHRLTAASEMRLQVPEIAVRFLFFRLPIGGGPDCRTTKPVTMELRTPAGERFEPEDGGRVAGSYDLPPLEGCGRFTGLINRLLSGPGNTIDLSLTARSN